MTTENVSRDEINQFSALAETWWDETGKFRPLHDINPSRLHYIDRLADINGKTVLDVGCGGGILTESMARIGANATGIDMAEPVINVAKLHAEKNELNIDYQLIPAEALAAQKPGQFDVVTCMEMLEHVPNPQSVIEACKTLVKPGGYVFFSTINRTPKAFLTAIVGAEYVLNILPKGTHHYKQLIKPSELVAGLRQAELELIDLSGMHYNPFTHNTEINGNVSVNYLVCAQRPQHD